MHTISKHGIFKHEIERNFLKADGQVFSSHKTNLIQCRKVKEMRYRFAIVVCFDLQQKPRQNHTQKRPKHRLYFIAFNLFIVGMDIA